MNTNQNQQASEILETIRRYPGLVLKAVEWLIHHPDIAETAARNAPRLSPERFQEELTCARAEEDYAYFAILLLQRLLEEEI